MLALCQHRVLGEGVGELILLENLKRPHEYIATESDWRPQFSMPGTPIASRERHADAIALRGEEHCEGQHRRKGADYRGKRQPRRW